MSGIVNTKIDGVLECLREQIEADKDDGDPGLCFIGRVHGEAPIADYASYEGCGDSQGMAWVRLGNLYPAARVGQPDEQPGNCGATIGLDIELGMIRWIGLGDDDGNPPEPVFMAQVADLCTKDAMTMWRAGMCCSRKTVGGVPVFGAKDYRITPYSPMGPLGGLMGGSLVISGVL